VSRRRRKPDPPGLTLEQKRERFFQREQRDSLVWHRLTPKQRRSPYWQHREQQWKNASRIRILYLMAGEKDWPLALTPAAPLMAVLVRPGAVPGPGPQLGLLGVMSGSVPSREETEEDGGQS
jgi:hypothetical protein